MAQTQGNVCLCCSNHLLTSKKKKRKTDMRQHYTTNIHHGVANNIWKKNLISLFSCVCYSVSDVLSKVTSSFVKLC